MVLCQYYYETVNINCYHITFGDGSSINKIRIDEYPVCLKKIA